MPGFPAGTAGAAPGLSPARDGSTPPCPCQRSTGSRAAGQLAGLAHPLVQEQEHPCKRIASQALVRPLAITGRERIRFVLACIPNCTAALGPRSSVFGAAPGLANWALRLPACRRDSDATDHQPLPALQAALRPRSRSAPSLMTTHLPEGAGRGRIARFRDSLPAGWRLAAGARPPGRSGRSCLGFLDFDEQARALQLRGEQLQCRQGVDGALTSKGRATKCYGVLACNCR